MRLRDLAAVCCLGLILFMCAGCNKHEAALPSEPEMNGKDSLRVRASGILAGMTREEKAGQLIMGALLEGKISVQEAALIKDCHLGGIVLFDRNMQSASQVRELTGELQKKAGKVPFFIAVDEEGGVVTRMEKELPPPPSQEKIGRTGQPEEAGRWAASSAGQLRQLGINLNFAPVADVGSDMERSYSTQPETAAAFVQAAASGYEEAHFLYTLKHFPGIGKGLVDSHLTGSRIEAGADELMGEDVRPFAAAIGSEPPEDFLVMVSHFTYPAFDGEHPASLSPAVITGLLRERLGFEGIIATDDMEMGAVSHTADFGSLAVQAVSAGADLVLVCYDEQHIRAAYAGLVQAMADGTLSEDRVNESVMRILCAKLSHCY